MQYHWRAYGVLHTTGDSSPGGNESRRISFWNRPKARSDTPQGGGWFSRSRQERREVRRELDAFKPLLLRADGYPLTRPARLNLRRGRGLRPPCAFITPMRVRMTSCCRRMPAVDWL